MEYRRMTGTGISPSLLGYGCMRFPLDQETHKLDTEKAQALIDRAMAAGVTYYDTAWPYHEGESETFLGQALTGYSRECFNLATKLPCWAVDSRERAVEIFQTQLERLRTDYVDFYLLHSLSRKTWNHMVELGILELLEEYQREGKLRYLGFSFHDGYEVFEDILQYRSWDFCQIQLNYMDTDHQAGLRGLELANRKRVPVVVMEPVKGGSLAQLPDEVMALLRALAPKASAASWAMRWVASQPGVKVVLSGMTTPEQLEDNLNTFSPFCPLREEERLAVEETARLLRRQLKNGCTGCRYCMPCPAGVDIPRSFQLWNSLAMYENRQLTRRAWNMMEPEA
ncbi:MAG: aldo/keto reductase, partial [Lawsonibacter sp.]|nr:aldo/keto reductase [Lawsonibacter sp.]